MTMLEHVVYVSKIQNFEFVMKGSRENKQKIRYKLRLLSSRATKQHQVLIAYDQNDNGSSYK